MDFQQAEQRAAELRQQRADGRMPPEQFDQQIALLRLQDAGGTWWQVDPAAEGWLYWDGAAWAAGTPPVASAPAMVSPAMDLPAEPLPADQSAQPEPNQAGNRRQSIPQSLLEFLGYYFKSAIKQLPKVLTSALIQGGVVWLLHSAIMIFINDGFGRSRNPFTDSLMALPREIFVAGSMFWILLGILFNEIKQRTLGRKISALLHLPQTVHSASGAAGTWGPLSVWLGASIALAIISLLNNFLLGLELAIFAMGALIDPRDIVRFILQLSWSDFQRLFQKTAPRKSLAPAWQNTILSGMVIGFLAGALILIIPIFYIRWVVTLVVVGITLFAWFNQKGKPAAGISALLFLVFLGAAVSVSPAFADDGGWIEAGGTLGGWLSSPGAFPTLIAGVPAALGFIFGSLIGNPTLVPPPLPPTRIYGSGSPEDPFRDYPDVNHPPYMDGVYGKGTVDDPYRDYDYGPQDLEEEPEPPIPVTPVVPETSKKGPARQPEKDDSRQPPQDPTKPKGPTQPEAPEKPVEGKDPQEQDQDQDRQDQDKPPAEPQDKDKKPESKEAEKEKEPVKPPVDERRKAAHRRELERLSQNAADANEAANDFWTVGADASDRSHEEVAREGAKAWEATKDVVGKAAVETKEIIKEVAKDPQIILDTVKGTGKDIVDGSVEVAKTTYDVGKDILTHPIDIGLKTLTGTASDLKDLTGKLGSHLYDLITDPEKLKTFLADATGYTNFSASWDPNTSLGVRLLHVGLGVYKVGMLATIPGRLTELGTTRLIFNEGARTLGTYEASEAFRTVGRLKQANDDFARLTGIDLGKTLNLGNLDEAYRVYQQFSK